MLKTITVIAVALVAAIAGVLVYAATKPDTFSVERSTSIKAPPEKIFALIDDLWSFNQWNPFEKKDPTIKGRYSGPLSAQRELHQRHLGHARPRSVPCEGHARLFQHGQHGRQGLRGRPRQPEDPR